MVAFPSFCSGIAIAVAAGQNAAAGSAGGGTGISSIRALRSILASVIFVALTAAPAYAWHGSGSITALAIDPQTPSTLYAGTHDRGVFKSTDGGATWSATSLTNMWVTALAIDPVTPSTIHAGVLWSWDSRWYGGGVFKSTDGGATWNSTTNIEVADLVIDPQTPTTIYARTPYPGAYKSMDGGATWVIMNLPSDAQALAIDPQTPTTLYVGVDTRFSEDFEPVLYGGGVYKSSDGGVSWSLIGLELVSVGSLTSDPQTSTTLYAGGYKSTDGGVTWSSIDHALIAIDPRTPTTLYAGTLSGVDKSIDGGATWFAVNTNLVDTLLAYGVDPVVWPLVIDPQTTTILYTGTKLGVFKTTDGGAYWTPTGLIQHSPLTSVAVNPSSVTEGNPSTGTVVLNAPAPVGGVTVALQSNDLSVATVPASLTVPAGASSANFTISTGAANVPKGVTISAAFDDATRSVILVVTPATIFCCVNLTQFSVIGGTPSTGWVILSDAAPEGGVTVALSSSNPAVATVPVSVTVPAGDTGANFTVSTSVVAASTSVTISGTYSGVTRSAVLTVVPAAALSSLSLSSTATGGTSLAGELMLNATAPAGGAVVTLSSSNPAVAAVPASVTVPAGATSATFTASTVTCTSGSVTISGTYGGATRSAELTVMAAQDSITIQAADYFANKRELRVAAKSTSSTATLQVYVTSTTELIGTLRNPGDGRYSGQFTWPANPQNITVRSSLCGSATKAVTSK
ncbi:MAG: hypothetical protein AUG00_00715 [Candidatus Rokubacteria bacterium 13_1_20CM_2_70_7]|nr:MAG: hypothetical protein AUG00_00715 [Candidatus Rokubacteria bacterium 13_1_20CM_2_70_7]